MECEETRKKIEGRGKESGGLAQNRGSAKNSAKEKVDC
jgi:hypothetical protein